MLLAVATLIVSLALVSASNAFAAGTQTGTSWLRAQILGSSDLPRFTAQANHITDISDVLPGSGAYFDTLRNGRILSGYGRSFLSYDGVEWVYVDLIEYTNAHIATILQRAWDKRPDVVLDPTGLSVQHKLDEDSYTAQAVVTRGRVTAKVRLTTRLKKSESVIDTAAVDHMLAVTARQQEARIDPSPDVDSSATLGVGSLHFYLLYLILLYAFGGQILVGFVIGVTDKATLEAIWRYITSKPKHLDSEILENRDIRPDVRRHMIRYRLGVVLRALCIALAIGGAYQFGPGIIGSMIILGVAAVGFTSLQLLFARRKASQTSRVTYSRLTLAATIALTSASVAIATFGALFVFLAIMARLAVPPDLTPAGAAHVQLAYLLGGIGLFGVADVPVRVGRRLIIRQARKLLDQDDRPICLLLRSFSEDRRTIRVRRTTGQHLFIERLSLRRREGFEELLAWSLWPCGPVVAVGEPGTRLPPLGAARLYFSDANWQAEVRSMMTEAKHVALILGRGPSLLWEVEQLSNLQLLHKALFILPPVSAREAQLRLTILNSALSLPDGTLQELDNGRLRVLAMSVRSDGRLICWTNRTRTDVAYEAAIEAATTRIHIEEPNPTAATLRKTVSVRSNVERILVRSPTRAAAQRARLRRLLAIAPWAIYLTLSTLTAILVLPAPPPIPFPGNKVGGVMRIGSLAEISNGRYLGVGWSGQTLVSFGQAAPPTAAFTFEGYGHQVVTDGEMAYVEQSSPNAIIGLNESSRGVYSTKWVTDLDSQAWDFAVYRDHIVAALPAQDAVLIINKRSGRVENTLHLPGGPNSISIAGDQVLVGSETNSTIYQLNYALTAIAKAVKIAIAPSRIVELGNQVYVASILDSSVAVYDAQTLELLHTAFVPATNGVVAATGSTIVVGTSERTPRLLYLTSNTLEVTRSEALPEQIVALVSTPDGPLGTFPDSKAVVQFAK